MSGALGIEDRLDIQDLLSRYAHHFDSGEGEAWAALFTPDAVCEAPSLRLEGAAQLRTLPATSAEHSGGKFRHQITNILTEPAGEGRVAVRAYGLMTDWNEGGKFLMLATYTGFLAKGPDGWRIADLKATPA
jgi:3-phenylpropionate/cinnamic acid dioxygenase small subunit